MQNSIRIALPGYNADTDTNLDHFALHSDQDNVLIKEFSRGTVTLGAGGSQDITHNLGYIPFFLVFVKDTSLSADGWALVGIPAVSGSYFTGVSTTILNIFNNTGGSLTFKYFIFYDELISGVSTSIVEKNPIFKVAKAGVNALTSKNPNDYIFHSNLNTFKIVKQGLVDIAITTGTPTYQFAHGSPLANTTCLEVFAKWPDGSVNNITPLTAQIYSKNMARSFNYMYFDNTNVYINYGGVSSNYTLHLAYFIYEAALT